MKPAIAARLCQAAVLALPVIGVLEVWAHHRAVARAPAFDDWGTIVAPVDQLREVGDVVTVAPRWAEPLARRALGDERMPLRDVARPDLSRYRAALEVSIQGERDPELAGWRETSRAESGAFTFRRLENPSAEVPVFDFVDAAVPERLAVAVADGAAAAPCPFTARGRVSAGNLGGHPTFPAARFQCPGGEFMNVSVTVIADEHFRARRCLFAHPPLGGRALELRYRGVELGTRIRGHGGIYWMVERELAGAPVELDVRVDGELVGHWVHRDGDGWAGFDFALGTHAGARDAEVVFAVRADDARHRHFCFEADSR
ncbi:MAG: hypothetical protein HY908_08055 [Myxococcales bacterium]|nr:hypothetical protein [Myxococcales bacterium]